MSEWATSILMFIGAGFVLLAGMGVLRMPDLFTRMQASTKASTLGVGIMLVAVAIHFAGPEASTTAALIAAFLVLTSPVAAHSQRGRPARSRSPTAPARSPTRSAGPWAVPSPATACSSPPPSPSTTTATSMRASLPAPTDSRRRASGTRMGAGRSGAACPVLHRCR